MTQKELKRLSRTELLELLLEQTQELEVLREKLAKAEELLAQRHLQVENAGTLAQAMVAINGVMEAAQAAADQYLENIVALESETRRKCALLLQQTAQEAEEKVTGEAQ